MKNLYDGSCDVINVLNSISGKWKLPVLWHLSFGNVRYDELKRRVKGITNIMLTRTLQDLEKNNLVRRIQYEKIPPHVEYKLTKHGRNIILILDNLKDWAEE